MACFQSEGGAPPSKSRSEQRDGAASGDGASQPQAGIQRGSQPQNYMSAMLEENAIGLFTQQLVARKARIDELHMLIQLGVDKEANIQALKEFIASPVPVQPRARGAAAGPSDAPLP